MIKILEDIFSITDYGETHHLLKLFGLKIKFPKREFAKKKKESPYYYYKKNNIDITTIPPATGQIRDIQLANLALLKELDYVCKQNGLKYWLDFGTLLGAVRHKGFIPWDDDIDTGMLREDYEKVIDAFNKSSRNPDIYAGYVRDKNNNYIIKIQHKKCPYLFVDIFPYDWYGKQLSREEQYEITNKIKSLRKQIKKESNISTENKILEVISKKREKIIQNTDYMECSDLVWGIDYGHLWENWFTRYDNIFPLSQINFENIEFPCPKNNKSHIKNIYNDYMAYPQKIGFGHSMFLNLTISDINLLKSLGDGV